MVPVDRPPSLSVLTVCGLSEIEAHGQRAVTHVLSLLDPGTPDPAGFTGYAPHHRLTLAFHDVIGPGPGLVPPTRDDVAAILRFGREIAPPQAGAANHLLVHCHMGISRSTAAMSMLLAQAEPDLGEAGVFERIVAGRPQAWPNSLMIGYADELLGRGGRFTTALAALYGRRFAQAPEIADFMLANGRAHEIAMARGATPALAED